MNVTHPYPCSQSFQSKVTANGSGFIKIFIFIKMGYLTFENDQISIMYEIYLKKY